MGKHKTNSVARTWVDVWWLVHLGCLLSIARIEGVPLLKAAWIAWQYHRAVALFDEAPRKSTKEPRSWVWVAAFYKCCLLRLFNFSTLLENLLTPIVAVGVGACLPPPLRFGVSTQLVPRSLGSCCAPVGVPTKKLPG
jgi:hypothetical protein